ncbi:hypothetical protein D3C72_2397230 [compost metagenome]
MGSIYVSAANVAQATALIEKTGAELLAQEQQLMEAISRFKSEEVVVARVPQALPALPTA